MSRWAGALGPGLKPQRLPAGPTLLTHFLNRLSETRGSQDLSPHTLISHVRTSTEHLMGDLRALCLYDRSQRRSHKGGSPDTRAEHRGQDNGDRVASAAVLWLVFSEASLMDVGEVKARRAGSSLVPSHWPEKGHGIPASFIPMAPSKP